MDISFHNPDNFDTDETYAATEVAHIVPHALNHISETEPELVSFAISMVVLGYANTSTKSDTKKYVWTLISMFCPGIPDLLSGPSIDSPCNAITLTLELHKRFGQLTVFFTPVMADIGTTSNSHYRFEKTTRSPPLPPGYGPRNSAGEVVFEDNSIADVDAGSLVDDGIPVPEPSLLAFHRACAVVLNMSGAGEYIENLLRDEERLGCLSDERSYNLLNVLLTRGIPAH
jgi:hypothetical protein